MIFGKPDSFNRKWNCMFKGNILVFWIMISNDLEINMPIKRKSKTNKIHVNFTLNVAFRYFLKVYTKQIHVDKTRIGITTR